MLSPETISFSAKRNRNPSFPASSGFPILAVLEERKPPIEDNIEGKEVRAGAGEREVLGGTILSLCCFK